MALNKKPTIFWGPPKKFTTTFEERKISWLELFYDLVYVIAISKITHYLAHNFNTSGFLDYGYLFTMIFWGWLNGSLYHDLHGSGGLRTRLMTLWQMMIISALVITFNSPPEHLLFNITIVLMVMQLYITYMWWSIGIYDKHHRKLNKPYTIIYLSSFALLFITLFTAQPYTRILFFTALILNYIPPFVTHTLLRKESLELSLSASMSERLGLFTIIIFGEVVLGVVNGVSQLHELSLTVWVNFGLSLTIVFTLWWMFFTLTAERKCKKGFINSSLLELLYIPTLIALGLMSVSFTGLFESFLNSDVHMNELKTNFGFSISLFLSGIAAMLAFLQYTSFTGQLKRPVQKALLFSAALFLILTNVNLQLSLTVYLLIVLLILLTVIYFLNRSWYRLKLQHDKEQVPDLV